MRLDDRCLTQNLMGLQGVMDGQIEGLTDSRTNGGRTHRLIGLIERVYLILRATKLVKRSYLHTKIEAANRRLVTGMV